MLASRKGKTHKTSAVPVDSSPTGASLRAQHPSHSRPGLPRAALHSLPVGGRTQPGPLYVTVLHSLSFLQGASSPHAITGSLGLHSQIPELVHL